jgi:hypothetical protein
MGEPPVHAVEDDALAVPIPVYLSDCQSTGGLSIRLFRDGHRRRSRNGRTTVTLTHNRRSPKPL